MTKFHRNTARSKIKGQKKKKSSRLLLLLQQKGYTPDPNDKDITEKSPKSDTKLWFKATLPANEIPPDGNISITDEAPHDNKIASECYTKVLSKATLSVNEKPP